MSAFAAGDSASSKNEDRIVGVQRIVDGDTIIVRGGERIRYIGIDTPEIGEPFYAKATNANKELIGDKAVIVKRCSLRPKDKHGRTLAFVYAGDADISLELLRRGLGRVFTDSTCLLSDKSFLYWKASRQAYQDARGIWKTRRGKIYKPQNTNKLIGRHALVRGIVKNVHIGEKAVHINFTENWRKDFSATIFKDVVGLFESAGIHADETLTNKEIIIFGYIGRHFGPNMVLHSPAQISF